MTPGMRRAAGRRGMTPDGAAVTPGRQRARRAAGRLIDGCLRSWAAAVFVFLFAPIVTTVIWAFNQGSLGKQTARFTGFTFRWFPVAWQDQALRQALTTSFQAAVAVAAISTLIGGVAGFALVRCPLAALRRVLEGQVYLLLIVPEIVLGISLLIFFTKAGIPLGLPTLIAGHSPFTIAVVSLIVRSRVAALRPSLEDASADLGAHPWRVILDVVVPQLRPALIASFILAFTFSFDDVVISLFLTTPTVSTLPVYLFGAVRAGITPAVYAIAAMMFGFTVITLTACGLLYRWQSRRMSRAPVPSSAQPVPAGDSDPIPLPA
jgi:ABC-type spermidine/putrescine transport system permease subunit II